VTSIQTNSPADGNGRLTRAKPSNRVMRRRWGAHGLGAAGVLCGAATAGAVLTGAVPSADAGAVTPSAAATRPPTSAECLKEFGVACYSPQQLQRAYNLAPLYAKGFDGKGRTIVVVDPFGSPTLAKDLATFDSALGLQPPPSLRVLQPLGKVPAFNPENAEMVQKAGETRGDVETAHEIAPGADIVVIETPTGETLSGGGSPSSSPPTTTSLPTSWATSSARALGCQSKTSRGRPC
jgi:hypothetical protein